jgi:hypothetical protein
MTEVRIAGPEDKNAVFHLRLSSLILTQRGLQPLNNVTHFPPDGMTLKQLSTGIL